ncbi:MULTISPECIES: hypothetical protein [unclassified Clostridium]|uniref:hypothetical protein n=1 Tax=unclassified Clostridium TaxID=2614128 RepID=UPI0002980E74|nr:MULTISPECIES: hypothetical protein [unclassified Clostridium]EKQ56272.1 MAG: hypothetical protein A370_02028 [Clostridium sp. Maddingley MBC34-26]
MLKGFTDVTITKDLTENIIKSLNDLSKKTVCIGIPDSTEHENSELSNAQILYLNTNGVRDKDMIKEMQHDLKDMPYSKAHELYVHEHGSPLWKIPPRPILQPAMDNKQNQEQMAELMKDAVNVALEGGNISPALEEVGMQGQNVAREWFTNPENDWAENAKSTIKAKGSDRPLIDTGELRKSITYIIKDGDI